MRYELTNEEWAAIKPMLPNKLRRIPRVNDRRVLNGIFWVLRSGAPWRDLPDTFGPYSYLEEKDPVSRAFRSIHGTKVLKVATDDDIFAVWREHTTGASVLIGQLRGVFRYRHWLAYGRSREPRLGRKYDYLSVYALAEGALQRFPLLGL